MIKRTGYIVGLVFMLMFCASLWAQQKNTAKPDAKKAAKDSIARKKKPVYIPRVYLGNSDFYGGKIPVKEFDSLLKQGIHSRDSAGNKFKVIGFYFNYAERELAEDSVGDMHWIMNYSSGYCDGDTINSVISETIYHRIKHGDTVSFDEVLVARPFAKRNTDTLLARRLKCEIIK